MHEKRVRLNPPHVFYGFEMPDFSDPGYTSCMAEVFKGPNGQQIWDNLCEQVSVVFLFSSATSMRRAGQPVPVQSTCIISIVVAVNVTALTDDCVFFFGTFPRILDTVGDFVRCDTG